MIRWLIRKWHARQRAIDIQILWPACRQQAATIDDAHRAFLHHTHHDAAWTDLGLDEVMRLVRELK